MFSMICAVANAQTVQFFTPNTVRIIKEKVPATEDKSVVVIAKPGKVKVTKKNIGSADPGGWQYRGAGAASDTTLSDRGIFDRTTGLDFADG